MTVQTDAIFDRTFDIEQSYTKTEEGATLVRPSYSIDCSSSLFKTGFPAEGPNFYETVETLAKMIKNGGLPNNTIFMPQHAIRGIEKYFLKNGQDPREAKGFAAYSFFILFGILQEFTSTALRVPKDWGNRRVDRGKPEQPYPSR